MLHKKRFFSVAGGVAMLALAIGVLSYFVLLDGKVSGADPDDPNLVALGKSVYAEQCAACHGVRLEGQANWRTRLPDGRLPAPPHDATGHTWHHPDQQLFDITKNGSAAFAPSGYKTDMGAFGGVISDREIWAVLSFIKSQWPPEIRRRQEEINRRRR